MSSPLCHEPPPAGRESPWNLQHPCRLGACPASGHLPVSPVLLRPDPSAPPPDPRRSSRIRLLLPGLPSEVVRPPRGPPSWLGPARPRNRRSSPTHEAAGYLVSLSRCVNSVLLREVEDECFLFRARDPDAVGSAAAAGVERVGGEERRRRGEVRPLPRRRDGEPE